VALALTFATGCGTISTSSADFDQSRTATTSSKPNIILIVLDDIGFAEIGCFGSEIRTPNMDALARDGLRYTRFDTKAICSPSRAALLTGRNNQTVRMGDLASVLPQEATQNDLTYTRGEMPQNAELISQALRQSGYRTVALGKWHLAPKYEDGSEDKRASWPLQRGFDQYYGFISGHAGQYHPDLIEGNAKLPKVDRPGYHLSVDLVDRAIDAMAPGEAEDSAKPVFLYLALGAAHAPHHVFASYRDKYAGAYDKGWDEIRRERFERQKEMGIIPQSTVLPERNAGDPGWSTLTAQQKKVFVQFMANYAGFIEHTDEQIGRLVSHLKSSGQYENTLIVLLSDNGPASEGVLTGGFNQVYMDETPLAEMEKRLDELGSPTTEPLYPRPWAMAGATPFRRYKLWPFAGGVRTPLIVSWPKVIKDGGAVRRQYVDIIDIAPTLLDAAGSQFRPSIDGREQIPVAGKSIRASFTSASAKSAREVQYFELRGNRAITAGPWKAIAIHVPGTDFAKDQWQLFNIDSDFSESTDLSAKYPRKLEELILLWMSEAKKYSDPPVKEMPERLRNYPIYNDAYPPGKP
jgi:arylsulfatase